MNFATWSIRNPIPSILLFILLSLGGVWGFNQLRVQNLPDVDMPTVDVRLTLPGAAPGQLETEVARRVEDSLSSVTGVKHLRTSITDGSVAISVEFLFEKNLSDALIETKDAVDSVRSDLPADLREPVVTAVRSGTDVMLVYAVTAPRMDEEALSWFVDDSIGKAVLGVPGVGRFARVGGVQREVRIEVDPVRLASLGVTAAEISRALREVEQQSSGGRTQLGGEEQSVRTIATIRHAAELDALPVALAGGRQVRLDQVATVHDGIAERTQIARLDGRPVVGFQVYRAKGFDETKIAEQVQETLDGLAATHPSLSFELVTDNVEYTREQYKGSMDMLYEGAFLAILVVWFFLRDWRATLVAATALPLSILPTFAAMAWLGFSLDILTLLALAIVVGILVDDAIVEIENIERHRHMGKSRIKAAEDAVTEIALAVIATTMSIVAVFAPTAMMQGIAGMLFKQFGWTAVIAVLSSLLVARLLTPMMAAYLLKPQPQPPREIPDSWIMTRYLAAIRWCLEHRGMTIAAAAAFLAASGALIPFIPTGFIPASDVGYTTVTFELPPGSSLQRTLGVGEAARKAVAGIDGIEKAFTTVGDAQEAGRGSQLAGEVRRGALTLKLGPRGERVGQGEIEEAVRARLVQVPGARFSVGGGGLGEKLSLILASDNAQALIASAQGFERQLRTIPQLSNITSTASLERPELVIRPDTRRAAEQGVTTAAIGETVRIATTGDFDPLVARLNADTRQIYVRARISDAARQDLSTIANMRVNGREAPVPLDSVASLSLESGPAQIDRYDRQRFVTIGADLGGMALGAATTAAHELPAAKSLPSSVKLIQTGDAELQAELSGGFIMAILIGILCVYCVLVLLFKDFVQPITILSAIPLSIGGAFFGLLVFDSELGLPAMIGLVMLMGIVTKNSILLVEYAIVGIRERGLAVVDALIDACHKRARPIVMTTVAMIAGMIPIVLGLGADSSFRRPMAVAVIGGLVTSTALSLLVVPVVFSYVDGFERRVRRWLGRRSENSPAPSGNAPAPHAG
ncbi:efflux RND transporter permease subunit [Sphingopyxis sp. MSC1_008]|jgi:multidrug efflux pump subunit AcrB|uniref:efflux RND transporter permease subunit n=1 Tax=Sphingopyxis sp. MSC1_008 TaxID=2909265 RepID=UPI0020BE2189|nr:efflux RND transporter permease subunit [Sphingopyxis sp. MSC1_008]